MIDLDKLEALARAAMTGRVALEPEYAFAQTDGAGRTTVALEPEALLELVQRARGTFPRWEPAFDPGYEQCTGCGAERANLAADPQRVTQRLTHSPTHRPGCPNGGDLP